MFLKPNFFRWEYKAPSENEIVSDGEFLYLYDPDLKQVIVSKLDRQINMSPAMLLVSDNVNEFFNTKLISNSKNNTKFIAEPKNEEAAFFKQVIFNFKNIVRINNEFQRTDLYRFNNFPYYAIPEKKFISQKSSSGLTFYRTSGHCWNTPTPCTGSLKSKIGVKKINGYKN